MRHLKRGRRLGRSASHRKAMLKNLASSLMLTERETDEFDENAPRVKGRVVTTLQKAKEVRPLVERCITLARKTLAARDEAKKFATQADRGSSAWREWRSSEEWQKWNAAIAPDVAARRRALQLLGDKQAVRILFEEIAPRFADRPGGYTRVLRLADPRLGDGGTRAVLEFVGVRDRVVQRSARPSFDDQAPANDPAPATDSAASNAVDVSDDSANDDA